jgi:hypothetical protein
MVLLTVGDSWTQGDSGSQTLNWEAEQNIDWYHIPPHFGLTYLDKECFDKKILNKFYDSELWPKTLGRNLGLETYNAGRLGTNNRNIVKTTINCLNYLTKEKNYKYTDIFVVIGFTSKYREQLVTYYPDKKLYAVNDFNFGTFDISMFKNVSFNYFMDEFCLQMYTLQTWLDNLNIKYLFFNAFEDQHDVKKSDFYNFNLKNWYNNSLDAHFRIYIENKYNKKWGKNSDYFGSSHPTDISHEDWGNNLTKYIIENKYI